MREIKKKTTKAQKVVQQHKEAIREFGNQMIATPIQENIEFIASKLQQ
jgi:hypothetical protein